MLSSNFKLKTGSQAIPFSTPRDRIRNKSVMKLLQKMFR